MDSPPVPLRCVRSPAWHMKSGSTRWKTLPLNHSGTSERPTPFSPVQRQRKFSQVFGHRLAKSSISMRPTRLPSMSTSKKTVGLPGSPATSSTSTLRFVATMSGGRLFHARSTKLMTARSAMMPKNQVHLHVDYVERVPSSDAAVQPAVAEERRRAGPRAAQREQERVPRGHGATCALLSARVRAFHRWAALFRLLVAVR